MHGRQRGWQRRRRRRWRWRRHDEPRRSRARRRRRHAPAHAAMSAAERAVAAAMTVFFHPHLMTSILPDIQDARRDTSILPDIQDARRDQLVTGSYRSKRQDQRPAIQKGRIRGRPLRANAAMAASTVPPPRPCPRPCHHASRRARRQRRRSRHAHAKKFYTHTQQNICQPVPCK